MQTGKRKFLEFHSNCYRAEMSEKKFKTFEDLLWEELTETVLRTAINTKGRTILYGLWHSARIEDMTINTLVNKGEQIYFSNNYREKINSGIDHTGNSLSSDEIIKMSKQINIENLCKYRIEVGRSSQNIINNIEFKTLKQKVDINNINTLRLNRSVDNAPSANWLLDFWGNKNVSGLLFMPACRHLIVHLRECFNVKERGLKKMR
jgi:hypothetical protein